MLDRAYSVLTIKSVNTDQRVITGIANERSILTGESKLTLDDSVPPKVRRLLDTVRGAKEARSQ